MCVGVLPTCMSMFLCVCLCLRRPEECIRSPAAPVILNIMFILQPWLKRRVSLCYIKINTDAWLVKVRRANVLSNKQESHIILVKVQVKTLNRLDHNW